MRIPTTVRLLAGLAIVSLAAIVPAAASAHGGAHDLQRVERERERGAGLRPGLRWHAHARSGYLHRRRRDRRGGLGSQGALAIERGWLLAVKAGSNDVSAFRVRGDHLALVNRGRRAARPPTASPSTTVSPTCSTPAALATSVASRSAPRPGAAGCLHAASVEHDLRRRAGFLHAARRRARRIGEGCQHDQHLPRRSLGPRRRRHRARLGRSSTVRLRVRQARCPQRDRGGRERPHVVCARSLHDHHRLAT